MQVMRAKQTATIYDWHTIYGGRLVGRILCHPDQEKFKSRYQATSPVIRWDLTLRYAETHNTIYTLGRRHDEMFRTHLQPTALLVHQLW